VKEASVEGPVLVDATAVDPPTDEELTALALAADPDSAVDADAVCLWDLVASPSGQLLPQWYMPAPMGGTRLLQGWRRRVAFLVIVSFILIDAYGLCSTYGQVVFA
jgi:hypothetical protein